MRVQDVRPSSSGKWEAKLMVSETYCQVSIVGHAAEHERFI